MSHWSDRKMGAIPVNHVHRVPRRFLAFYASAVKTKGDKAGKTGEYVYRCHAASVWKREGGAWRADGETEGFDLLDFWSFLKSSLRKKCSTWTLTYNVAWSFTILDGWDNLSDGTWKIGPCVLEDSPIIARVRRDEGRMRLLDLRNYWSSPLPELMRSVNVLDGNCPHDGNTPETWLAWTADRCKAIAYLFMRLTDLWDEIKGGNFGCTAGSCAWANYRHSFYSVPIELHQNANCLALERDAYRGGFSDAFYVGNHEGRVTKLDVNSGYPWCMTSRLYPSKLARYDEDTNIGRCKILNDPANAVADVLVETDKLPVHVMFDGRFLAALGCFRTCLAGDELAEAVAAGLVRRVFRVAEFEVANLFGSYVSFWYARKVAAREEGDLAAAETAKLMLCALNGKFVQRMQIWEASGRPAREKPFQHWTAVNAESGESCEFRAQAWRVEKLARRVEWTYSFPAITAMITARLRMRMKHLRAVAGERAVLAQHVDGLYVTDKGLRALIQAEEICPTVLGKLRIEHSADGIDVKGPGSVWHGNQRMVCGLSIDAVPLADGAYLQSHNQGVRSILAQTCRDRVTVKEATWNAVRPYDKGFQSPSGWTSPYVIADGRIVSQ